MNKSFKEMITDYLGGYYFPQGNYTLPQNSEELKIDPKDKEIFIQLYYMSPNKGVGNGEIAIYWLFSKNNEVKENRGGDNADLLINNTPCEVKSFPSHNQKIALGKWKEDVDNREILNSAFSFSNIMKTEKVSNSELKFNIDDVTKGFNSLLKIKEELSFMSCPSSYPSLTSVYGKSIDVLNYTTGSTSEEMSYHLINNIIRNKINKKPGDFGYIINIKPKNPTDIMIHKINLSNLLNMEYKDLKRYFSVESGTIQLNYNIFN